MLLRMPKLDEAPRMLRHFGTGGLCAALYGRSVSSRGKSNRAVIKHRAMYFTVTAGPWLLLPQSAGQHRETARRLDRPIGESGRVSALRRLC